MSEVYSLLPFRLSAAHDALILITFTTSVRCNSWLFFHSLQIGSRSSVYSPESSVRKTGSYIYEEFMPTDGTDVKVGKDAGMLQLWGNSVA